jgi:hypothetical protein
MGNLSSCGDGGDSPCPDEEFIFFILRANYKAKKKERCYYTTFIRLSDKSVISCLYLYRLYLVQSLQL